MSSPKFSSPTRDSNFKRDVPIANAPETAPASDATTCDINNWQYITVEAYGAHADTTSVTVQIYVQDDHTSDEVPRLYDQFTIVDFTLPSRIPYALPGYAGVAMRVSAMSDTGSGDGAISLRLKRTNYRPE